MPFDILVESAGLVSGFFAGWSLVLFIECLFNVFLDLFLTESGKL